MLRGVAPPHTPMTLIINVNSLHTNIVHVYLVTYKARRKKSPFQTLEFQIRKG